MDVTESNCEYVTPSSDSKVPLQEASLDIWRQKYRLCDAEQHPVDHTIHDTAARVAKALADIEPKRKAHWRSEFLWALENGAIPAGRILSNAGAQAYKPETSTINCTVSGTIDDSMKGILEKNLEAGLTLKSGCGIGYEFSTLRPKGAYVSGAGAYTSGPLSFMEIFDKMCFTVSSAGGRRGAQMATFDVHHPDVQEFIRAKRQDGCLRQFNLSLLITDDFIDAVRQKKNWTLSFPISRVEQDKKPIDLNNPEKVVWRVLPHQLHNSDNTIQNDKGATACLIYKTLPAHRLWDQIMTSTYDYAEPGFILIDRVNQMNNNWFCETIRATNPCGEQPLPPYGSCLLGSINLTHFVEQPLTDEASFNWEKYRQVIRIFTRMLDNVVEINGLALPQQQHEIQYKRRHGMGFLGLGSAMALLKIPYGSADSIAFTEQVSQILALTGWQTGIELAKEKGPAPIFNDSTQLTAEHFYNKPQLSDAGLKVGDSVSNKVLFSDYSEYMQGIASVEPEIIAGIKQYGCRFTHHSSIAPTGTIALSLGNNVSNGIEPSFAHEYSRNIIRPGKKTKEKISVYSYEWLLHQQLYPDITQQPDYFVCSDQITPTQHVDVQAAAQKWIDSSISKTINVPTDIRYESFKNIYLYACDNGLKGCTTFRFNPEAFQGVLVKETDLENTMYVFTLADGQEVQLKGNDTVEYDGELHTAANLYDALKEGYYGKF